MINRKKRRVAYINEMIESGHAAELVAMGEKYHQHQLARIARNICSRANVRVVLIAGPSSSGKTPGTTTQIIYIFIGWSSPGLLYNYIVLAGKLLKGFNTMPGKIPKELYINIDTVSQDIDNVVCNFMTRYDLNINDLSHCKAIPHNIITLCMLDIYNNLFKPNKTLCNNQKSLIDYDNIDLLTIIANKFIELSLMFNKSMGIMQFSIMTGIHWQTLARWEQEQELNPSRYALVKNIRECHKMEQINLLNDSPVGALAVANNDPETGLEWSKQQAQQITQNQVFILPSERMGKLKLDKLEQ